MEELYKTEYMFEGSTEWQSHEGHLPLPILEAMDEAYNQLFGNHNVISVRLVNSQGEVKVTMGADV